MLPVTRMLVWKPNFHTCKSTNYYKSILNPKTNFKMCYVAGFFYKSYIMIQK